MFARMMDWCHRVAGAPGIEAKPLPQAEADAHRSPVLAFQQRAEVAAMDFQVGAELRDLPAASPNQERDRQRNRNSRLAQLFEQALRPFEGNARARRDVVAFHVEPAAESSSPGLPRDSL